MMRDSARLSRLRQHHYRYYLAYWLAAPERQPFALWLFELATELESIPAKVSQPTLGLMRIVWWRDAIIEPGNSGHQAHPLLANAPHLADPDRLLLGRWVETFDQPLIEAADGPERLAERNLIYRDLLGHKVAAFLNKSSHRDKPLRLVWLAMRCLVL